MTSSDSLRGRVPIVLCLLVPLLTAALPAHAQPAGEEEGSLVLKLQLCRSVQNRAFRLHCFDRLAQDLPGRAEEPAVARGEPDAAVPEARPAPMPPQRPASETEPTAVAEAEEPAAVPEAEQPAAAAEAEEPASVAEAEEPVAVPETEGPSPEREIAAAISEPASEPAPVPLPPTRPGERRDLAGLLDGGLPEPPAPDEEGDEATSAEIVGPQGPVVIPSPGEAANPPEDDALPEAVETASLPPAATSNPTAPKRSWSVSDWTSPLSGVRDISVTRASEANGDAPITLLSFSCSADFGAVQVMWPTGMSAEQVKASLTLDGEAEEPTTWSLSDDGRTMSRENRSEAVAIARRIAAAERVTIRIEDRPGLPREAEFTTEGLKSHLPDLQAACTG